MAFAPTLEIEYNSISCDQAVLLGNYTPNGHSVARFTLYVGLHPERLLPFSQNSQYYGGAQGNYFLLSNLTPGDTVSKSVSENRKKVREFYSFVK